MEQESDAVEASRPEASQVHNKEGRNVVGLAPEVLLPKALLPEPEPLHVLVVVTEGREAKRGSLQNRNRSTAVALDHIMPGWLAG